MSDPNAGMTTNNLEGRLAAALAMPHNRVLLNGQSPEQKARQLAQEVTGAFVGTPEAVEFVGPKRFLRAAGPQNSVFGGSWWFEEKVLIDLENAASRVPLSARPRSNLIQRGLREKLAVSVDWNPFSEMWILELPAGERVTGLAGRTAFQPIFSVKHPLHDSKQILSGGGIQIYFLVKNPLWIRRYS